MEPYNYEPTTSIGNAPLDNDTYMECHNAYLSEILRQWKKTNFWLSCIGAFFLILLILIVCSALTLLFFGFNLFSILSL